MFNKSTIFNFFNKRKNTNISFNEGIDMLSNLNREIYITTITPQVAEHVDKAIRAWNKFDDTDFTEVAKRPPIKLYINSLGGDFNAMLTIMDAIKISKTPIHTINIGVAYNEAFYVFIAGHQRFTYINSSFRYIRDIRGLLNEELNTGNELKFYERQLIAIKDIILTRTKITETEYNKHLNNIWYLDASDAQRLKVCHDIITKYQG